MVWPTLGSRTAKEQNISETTRQIHEIYVHVTMSFELIALKANACSAARIFTALHGVY